MSKVSKDKTVNMRINVTLKQRFEWALEQEGLEKSDFLTAKIMELIERVEKRQKKEKPS